MKASPLELVKQRFGDKEQLVAKVQELATADLLLDRMNTVKGLSRVSNAKLLRLHDVLTRVKADFGSRQKLIEAVLALEKRDKDEGYRARLERYPTPRLVDLHRAATRRKKTAQTKAGRATPPKKRLARSKKAQAKARGRA